MQHSMYPCLWFDNNAKEAATFYTTAFSKTTIAGDTSMVVLFQSAGQQFMCLNGGKASTRFCAGLTIPIPKRVGEKWACTKLELVEMLPLHNISFSFFYLRDTSRSNFD